MTMTISLKKQQATLQQIKLLHTIKTKQNGSVEVSLSRFEMQKLRMDFLRTSFRLYPLSYTKIPGMLSGRLKSPLRLNFVIKIDLSVQKKDLTFRKKKTRTALTHIKFCLSGVL